MTDAAKLKEKAGDAVLETEAFRGQETAVVERSRAVECLRILRDDPDLRYDMLLDVTSVDYSRWPAPVPGRFCVVYHLWSVPRRRRFRLKAFLPESDPVIGTASGVYPAANWGEREVFDLMGVRFEGHPDLRRLLLPDAYEGHPLRKEYPLEGRGERERFSKYDPDEAV